LATVTARLHHERIGDPAARRLVLTHGIYGAGNNLRTVAKKLVTRRPDWEVVLVDLRQHGRSERGSPPHRLASAADDLRALVDELGGAAAIAGHSFGGKVALATRALAPPGLLQTWMLDASPSARPGAERDETNSVIAVLVLMEQLPRTWPTREAFVAAVVAAGQPTSLAQWLAMNLVPDGNALTLRLDLAAIREMLTDYYAQDLWAVAFDPTLPGTLEVVIAEHSGAVSQADQSRLAAAPPHVHVHRVAASHWLHVEAPEAVVELFARVLPPGDN
jgi:esterase